MSLNAEELAEYQKYASKEKLSGTDRVKFLKFTKDLRLAGKRKEAYQIEASIGVGSGSRSVAKRQIDITTKIVDDAIASQPVTKTAEVKTVIIGGKKEPPKQEQLYATVEPVGGGPQGTYRPDLQNMETRGSIQPYERPGIIESIKKPGSIDQKISGVLAGIMRTGETIEQKAYKGQDSAANYFYRAGGQTLKFVSEAGRGAQDFLKSPVKVGTVVAITALTKNPVVGARAASVISGITAVGLPVLATKTLSDIGAGKTTPGYVAGQVGAGAAVSYGSSKLIDKLSLAYKQDLANIKGQVQEFKFAENLRRVQAKTPYVSYEGLHGAQRTLWGKSISDKTLKQSLSELSKYKIGYGIEKNPLVSYDTYTPTGQTKLSTDKIIAYDSFGNIAKVKVVDHQPFVLDPNLGKYIEFNPKTYSLYTISGSETTKLGVATTSNYITKPTRDVQTTLSKEVINRAMKPFTQDKLATISGMSKAPLKIFSRSSVKSSAIPKLQLFGKTITSQTSAYAPEGAADIFPAIKSAASLDITPGVATGLAIFSGQKTQGTQIQVSQQIPKQDFEIKFPRAIYKQFQGQIFEQTPISGARSKTRQKTKQVTETIPGTMQETIAITSPAQFPMPAFPVPAQAGLPMITGLPKIQAPNLPGWFFGKSKMKQFPGSRRNAVKQPKSFFPTLKSNILAEFGKTPKFNIVSGLGERFIPKKKKKKQRGFLDVW